MRQFPSLTKMAMFSQITTVPAVHMRVMPMVAAVMIILAITSVVATLWVK